MDPENPPSNHHRPHHSRAFKSRPAQHTFEVGPFRITPIDAGSFRLDGGAMFGVVPKTLWSRAIESDALNRIPMAMRCMLVESEATGRIYLVDTGAGTKFDQKMSSIYDLSYATNASDIASSDPLLASLAGISLNPDDITDVIFTHLHFDHCGGAVKRSQAPKSKERSPVHDTNGQAGAFELTFPHAAHHVCKRHWETATAPNAREKASFLKENMEPLQEALTTGVLLLEEDHTLFEPGFDTLVADGHTSGQWLPRVKGSLRMKQFSVGSTESESREGPGETTVLYAADLIPTQHHVPLPWVMGYDMRPIITLEEKQKLLAQAAKEHWMLFLEHDPSDPLISIRKDEKGRFHAVPITPL